MRSHRIEAPDLPRLWSTIPERLQRVVKGMRLQTLVRLRWLAVLGQTTAVLVVYFGLGFSLPIGPCLAIIAVSAWINIFLTIRWRTSLRLQNRYALAWLAYDIVQLAGLLFLTGGMENPFAFLLLIPVTVGATMLPLPSIAALDGLALAAVSGLAVWHLPLPWHPGEALKVPDLYVLGSWVALVCGIVFSSLYAYRVASEARQMSDALAATEAVMAREHQLTALDGLAAAAAHELGTPLATILLVAKELSRELQDEQHHEDIALLLSQAMRCREILSRLATREGQSDEMFARVRLTAFIEDMIAPLRGEDVEFTVTAEGADGSAEPVVARNPAIAHGLGNLLDNAAEFADHKVDVKLDWNGLEIVVTITDDGPGFAQGVIDRLGEPYVTTRPGYGMPDTLSEDDRHQGMGLGFFIAKTLLERSGASVTLANRARPRTGATVRVAWPRDGIDLAAGAAG